MQTMDDVLAGQAFFAGLAAEHLGLIAGCGRNVHVRGREYLFREGEAADAFYVLRRGRVAIEVHDPRGGGHVIDTVEAGDVVGWSWLVPPYRWMFDARAVDDVDAVSFDAACLRGKCDADPALGYALMQRVAHVMHARLQAARVRLLDLYGGGR